ncbi:hypothetical protein BJ944DRAFT_269548 [Cunninghamella echinulata]|nr:hypothetical protein BJ944DRAFT_269548 [Cunninghamella echinulata]
MGDEVGTIENGRLIYRIDCDKHYLSGVPPILVLQKDSVKPPILILEGTKTQPDSKPIIRDERKNKSLGYIIQDNRTLPAQQVPSTQQSFYPPPSTTEWNQNSPTMYNNSTNLSSQDPSFYGNQPFHLLSPSQQHDMYPYQQQQQPPSPYDHYHNHNHQRHSIPFHYYNNDLMDPLSPSQQQHEPFYWNTPKLSSSQPLPPPSSSSSSHINDHWVLPNQNDYYNNNNKRQSFHQYHHDNSYYPTSPVWHPSDQQHYSYNHNHHHNNYPLPSPTTSSPGTSLRQPPFRLVQRPN